MNRPLILRIFAFVAGVAIPLAAQVDTLHLRLDDIIGKRGQAYVYPVHCLDSLTAADSVFSGEFTVSHNGSVIDVAGLDTAGTLLGAWSNLTYNAVTRRVAFARSQALTGRGVLFALLITIKNPSSGTTPVMLTNAMLNDGAPWDPVLSVDGGTVRPMDIAISPKNPPQDRVVGDTIAFTVSGDVMHPVTWSVSDTHVVSIDGTGRVIGRNVGQTSVSVTDAQGLSDQSGVMPVRPAALRSLQMTVRDTSVMQNLTFDLPVYVSDVSSLGIVSAQFTLTFNASVLTPLGVVHPGTLSESWASEINKAVGSVSVAMSGAAPLTGSGVLLYVRFKVQRFAVTGTAIALNSVLFNDDITAALDNGFFSPIAGPTITIGGLFSTMIGGESKQLTASGGTAPYRWKVLSDTNTARIDSATGLLSTKKSGPVTVTAADVNGFDGTDSMVVKDVRAIFADTAFVYTDSVDVPLIVSPLNGLSVVAGQLTFAYDPVKLRLTDVVQASTLTETSTLEFRDSAGIVSIGFSSGSVLTGSGTLMKFRFKATGVMSAGHQQVLSAQSFFFNENGPTYRSVTQVAGMVRVRSAQNNPPVFVKKLHDTTITENQTLSFQLIAIDPDGDPVTYAVENPPSGLTCSSQGLIVWTPAPSQVGMVRVRYSAVDSKAGGVVTDSAVITVTAVNRAPVFTRSLPDTVITVGVPFSYRYEGTDPDSTTPQFSLLAAPSGSAITLDGMFSWTPAPDQTGTAVIIVGLTDGIATTRDTAVVTILPFNRPPVLTSAIPDTTISENELFVFACTAADPENDTLVWALLSPPPSGLTISASGRVQWTPTYEQAGTYTVIIGVRDPFTTTADTSFLTVRNVNRPPRFLSVLPDLALGVDSTLSFPIVADDPDNDPISYFLVKTTGAAQLSPSGVFTWKPVPADLGRDTFIVAASDGAVAVYDTAVIDVYGFPRVTVSSYRVEFGTLPVGAHATMTGTVSNTGHVPLLLRSMMPAPGGDPFTFDSSSIMKVPPGEQRSYSVVFTPFSSGARSAVFAFTTNDPLMPLVTFTAHGVSVGTSAIPKKVLVDNAHQNRLTMSDSLAGIAPLFALLRQSGMSLTIVDSALHPEGFDALLLMTPSEAYSAAEAGRIRAFVAGGGSLIAVGKADHPGNGFLNSLLNDTVMNAGLTIHANRVTDPVRNAAGDPAAPLLTDFFDPAHPYCTNVDTLLFINSASISVNGNGVPFLRTGPFGRATGVADSVQPAVIGISAVGKGSVIAVGSLDAWSVDPLHPAGGSGILAKDNLPFAMNLFSVTEGYTVQLPAATPNERYQLVSIPFDLDDAGIATVLKDLGGVNPLVWRLFGKFNPITSRYAEFPGADFRSFRRGEAYWLITRGRFNLRLGTTTLVPAQDYYPISIGPGYSMFGNPFPYRVSWKQSRIGDSVQTTLWAFNGSSFRPESLSLEPFAGYFVRNLSKDSVTIHINPVDITSGSIARADMAALWGPNEWRVVLSAASGASRDDHNIAGMSPGARREYDRFDIAEPPNTPTDYVMFRFDDRSWERYGGAYAVDIRPPNAEGEYWDAEVITSKPNAAVSLSLRVSGSLPAGFQLVVIDTRTERAVEVGSSGSYDFTMGKQETTRRVRLIAGCREYIERHSDGIPVVPLHFALEQNYPNPFNPSTVIRYSLGHSGDVTVTIANLLGQTLRTFTKEFQPIGVHTIEWDGKTETGAVTATGIYFYTIAVRSNGETIYSATKKMVLLK